MTIKYRSNKTFLIERKNLGVSNKVSSASDSSIRLLSTSTVFSPQDIAVIKIVLDDGKTFGCYASPLNDKDAANPSAVRKSFDNHDDQVRAILK